MIKFLLDIVLSICKGHVSYHNLNPTIIPHWPPLVYIYIYILRHKIVQYYAVHKPKRQFKFRNKVLGPKNHGKDI